MLFVETGHALSLFLAQTPVSGGHWRKHERSGACDVQKLSEP